MATLREIRTRITSVKSTQQITKGHENGGGSQTAQAQEKILATRPYAKKLAGCRSSFNCPDGK